MSTNGLTSWAVDLKDIGAIYPFQGWEVLLVILGFAFWIGWRISRRARRTRRLQPHGGGPQRRRDQGSDQSLLDRSVADSRA